MNVLTSRSVSLVLLLLVFTGTLRAAEKTAPGNISVTLLGEVLKKGKIQLREPATIDDAFAAAGGFNREESAAHRRDHPASYCVLMTRDHGVDMNMQVRIKVNLKTGVILVTDKSRRTVPLKNGDTVILPVITR